MSGAPARPAAALSLRDALLGLGPGIDGFLADFAHVAPPTLAAALARCRAECAAPAHADPARHRLALAMLANFGEPAERREAEALLAAMESADA